MSMAKQYTAMPEIKPSVILPVQSSRVLMATVVSGDAFEALYTLTGPYHEAYARKHGYDYRVIREPKRKDWPSPSWWKLDLYHDLSDYDCVVFVDADAWPWHDAPDITQAVPRGKFGAFNSLSLAYMNNRNCHSQKSYHDWCERAGLHWQEHDPIDIGYYINGGVWACWRDARDVLTCDTPTESAMYVEQHQLNWNLYERPGLYHELPREWNWGHLMHTQGQQGAASAWIAHLNGAYDRPAVFRRVVGLRDAQSQTQAPSQAPAKQIKDRNVPLFFSDHQRDKPEILEYVTNKGFIPVEADSPEGAIDLTAVAGKPVFTRNRYIKQHLGAYK